MTEREWLACTNPFDLLGHLRKGIPSRQLCRFVCACWNEVRDHLTSESSRAALATLENAVEGPWVEDWFREMEVEFYQVGSEEGEQTWQAFKAGWDRRLVPFWGALLVSGGVVSTDIAAAAENEWVEARQRAETAGPEEALAWADLGRHYCAVLRCLFGNPFRPLPTPGRTWMAGNSNVVHLAQVIDAEQRFADLPVLADALEDAGCTSSDLLAHLREPGPHVRGCWALGICLGLS
jgi:hypothetical protein